MTETLTRAYGSYLLINLFHPAAFPCGGNKTVRTYPVGVGKPSTPTPTGKYKVVVKVSIPEAFWEHAGWDYLSPMETTDPRDEQSFVHRRLCFQRLYPHV